MGGAQLWSLAGGGGGGIAAARPPWLSFRRCSSLALPAAPSCFLPFRPRVHGRGGVVHYRNAGLVCTAGFATTDGEQEEEEEEEEEEELEMEPDAAGLEEFYDGTFSLLEGGLSAAAGQGSLEPQKLCRILEAGDVSPASKVLVALGGEAFVDELLLLSPSAVELLHFSLQTLSRIKEKYDEVRCWHMSVPNLPDVSGPFDVVFLNHLSIFVSSPQNLFRAITDLCRPGARIVVSYPRARCHLAALKERSSGFMLSDLPDTNNLKSTILSLPLEVVNLQDEPDFYIATLKVTGELNAGEAENTWVLTSTEDQSQIPLQIRGEVVHGLGRGRKQLGFPTANLSVEKLPKKAAGLRKGVYYGWAQVIATGIDSKVHEMVMNVGHRPTFNDSDTVILEVHILHHYGTDFYGKELRLIVLGYIREEIQFSSADDLMKRILLDIEIAQKLLSAGEMQAHKDLFFAF